MSHFLDSKKLFFLLYTYLRFFSCSFFSTIIDSDVEIQNKIDDITLKNIKDYENASRSVRYVPIIEICEEISIKSIFDDQKAFNDDLPFIKMRKLLLLFYRLIWLISNKIVTNKYFEWIINLIIIYICYLHAIKKSDENREIDSRILIFFCCEYFLRSISHGLFNEQSGILRNPLFFFEILCILINFIINFLTDYDVHYNLLIFRFLRVLKFLPLKNMGEIIEGNCFFA